MIVNGAWKGGISFTNNGSVGDDIDARIWEIGNGREDRIAAGSLAWQIV